MPLPGDINTIILTGTYLDPAGSPRSGSVSFTPATAPLADTTGKVILCGVPVTANLSNSGSFSITLPCTDGLTPPGWAWTVTEQIQGTQPRAYAIQLPHTLGSTADISTLVPVVPVPSVSPYGALAQANAWTGANAFEGETTVPAPVNSGDATTKAYVDAAAAARLPLSGGTMTGPLKIAATGSTGAITPLHYGYQDSDAPTGIVLQSSYPSDDVTGGTDGTARLNLYSYQRANTYSFGETIRNFLMRYDAKAMTAWYGPTGGSSGALTAAYDGSGNATGSNFKPWTWVGSHYEANDHASIHGHWEVEIPDATGALQGRLAILFANTTTGAIGLDKTTINTNLADFHVYCHGLDHTGTYQQQFFRLVGSLQKAIEWNNDDAGGTAGRRWKLASTETAESGGNAGSDWFLYRYDDSGNLVDNPIEVTRSNGKVQIGGNSGTSNGLTVNSNSGVAVTVNVTNTGGQAYLAIGADATARSVQGEVSGDATVRHVVFVDGKNEWGDGTSARDTNLYRSAANLLKTDDSLEVATKLAVGAAPAALSFAVSSAATGQLAQFTRSSASDASPVVVIQAADTASAQSLGLLVAGDAVSRFGVGADGKMSWGDGTNPRDANLYRSSAGHLKTDEFLSAVQGLLINTTSVASGVGVLAIADAATPPSGSPSGGGVFYSASGVPHWLNSSGGDFALLPGTAPRESDLSYAAWAYDPVAASNATAPASGTVYGGLIQVRTSQPVTKVILGIVSTSGMSLTSGQNFVAIYDHAGAQVGVSADITASVTTSGELALSLTGSAALTPGFYWAAFLLNGTTPTLARGENVIPALGSGQSGSSKRRFGTIATSVTSMPGSFTPSSMGTSGAISFWLALA